MNDHSLCIKDLIENAAMMLKNAGVPNPQIDALLIMSFTVKRKKEWLIAHDEYIMTRDEELLFNNLIKERINRIPLNYITKQREFYGNSFFVNNSVLIPRQETETLIDASLEYLKENNNPIIIDAGTGSGIIAISLALHLKKAEIIAFDYSIETLDVCKKNIKLHNVNITPFICDIRSTWNIKSKIDLIVSNPPYITYEEYKKLSPEVKKEPEISLICPEPFYYYDFIAQNAMKLLKTDGVLVLEAGESQVNEMEKWAESSVFKILSIYKDLGGFQRAFVLTQKMRKKDDL